MSWTRSPRTVHAYMNELRVNIAIISNVEHISSMALCCIGKSYFDEALATLKLSSVETTDYI